MIRAGTAPGRITLTASAEGLSDVSASATSTAFEENVLAANARPIYEPLLLQADIGWDEAHVEDGWTGWFSDGSQKDSYSFEHASGLRAEIRPLARNGKLTWAGKADVAGPLGRVAEDGIHTPADSGLQLSFTGLEAGTYQVRTYHHAARREIDGYRGDLPSPRASPQVKVTVADANGVGRQITSSLRHSIGLEVGNSKLPEHTNFTIRANGTDAVTIRFAGEMGRLWINGLELREQMK